MDSKGNRMCTVDANGHEFYIDDDDDQGLGVDMLDIPDSPVKSLEEDGLNDDWSKLGPIPAEVFEDVLPPVLGHGGGMGYTNLATCLNNGSRETKLQPVYDEETFKSQLKQQPATSFLDEKKLYRIPIFFEAPSPDSVLERRSSTSNEKRTPVFYGSGVTIPVKPRSKRSRFGSNKWSKSTILIPIQKVKKKRRILSTTQQPVNNANKKCSHCEITKTPQWREGPMGPKTLCNACGVRYRSGRLFPEYRPAASPTFIPSLHSNSHRKVIQMRQKGARGIDNDNNNNNNNYVVKKPPSSISTSLVS